MKKKIKEPTNKYKNKVIFISWAAIILGLIINPSRIKGPTIFTATKIGLPGFFNYPISIIEHLLGPFFVGIILFSIIYVASIILKDKYVFLAAKIVGITSSAILSLYAELEPILRYKNFGGLYQFPFDIISLIFLGIYLYNLEK